MEALARRIPKLLPWVISGASVLVFSYLLYQQRLDYIAYIGIGLATITFGLTLLFNKSWLLLGTIALIPLSLRFEVIEGGLSIALPSELLASILMIITWLYIALKPTISMRVIKHPITILLTVDLCWLIVCSIFSSDPAISMKRVLIRFLFISVFYLLLAHYFRHRENMKKLYFAYGIGLVIVVLYVIYAHSKWGFSTRFAFAITEPFYDDHTIYGACIAFIIPFFWLFYAKRKLFGLSKNQGYWVLTILIILLAGEFFSYSRAAWLSLVAILIFAALIRYRIKLWHIIASICFVAMLGISLSDQIIEATAQNDAVSNSGDVESQIMSVTNVSTDASNLERINRWVSAWNMFLEKPVTGFGPGTYQFEYHRFQVMELRTYISTNDGDRGNAHSEYLTYLSEAGLPGFISFLILVFTTLGYALRTIYQAKNEKVKIMALATTLGLTTFFIHGLFNSFIDQDKIAVLVFGAMAIIVAIDVHFNRKPEDQSAESNP